MSWIRISLFGEVAWRPTDGVAFALESSRAQELLAYLLLHGHKRIPREMLATVIWADQPAARARQYLRKAIWQLQSALQATGIPEALTLIESEGDDLGLATAPGLWVDAAEFERACLALRGTQGRDLEPDAAAALRSAVSLYRGELLEGWYQEWCIEERERFQLMFIRALDRLVAYAEAHGEHESGIEDCRAVLALDPAREYTHRALMRLLFGAGDRTGALRQFERCEAALREELDVAPSAQTLALRDRIRAGEESGVSTADPPLETGGLVSALRRLQGALETAQHEVSREIEALTGLRRGR